VARVVLGTAAVRDPELVAALCEAHPAGVVVAVDARHGEVAVQGWTEGSGISALELARKMDALGVAAILHTAIERDGTREGPDVAATAQMQDAVKAMVIASGGIGSLEHVRGLARSGVRAAVCGRALFAGAFTLPQAIAAASESGLGSEPTRSG
jgi:phosphoribosylformimino-5-aminoimidazole carboxamide ribotide isomerase